MLSERHNGRIIGCGKQSNTTKYSTKSMYLLKSHLRRNMAPQFSKILLHIEQNFKKCFHNKQQSVFNPEPVVLLPDS